MGVVKETYPAIVTANEDDENRGRIRIACAQLLGDEETELPMWVEPLFSWGMFVIPDVGEIVDVEVVVDSDEDEIRGQMSIDNLDIHWRGQRYYTDEIPQDPNTTPTLVHPDFTDNYAKRRGFSTPQGHIIMFDDDPSNPRLWISWSKTKLAAGMPVLSTDISKMEFQPDGSFKVTLLDKHNLHFQTDNNKMTIQIDSGTALELADKDSNTTLTIGDGAKSAVIAEALKNYIDNSVKVQFDAHTHPDAMGGTGPPATQMPNYDTAITSTKITFPDG